MALRPPFSGSPHPLPPAFTGVEVKQKKTRRIEDRVGWETYKMMEQV